MTYQLVNAKVWDGSAWVEAGPKPTVTVSGASSDTVTNISGTDYRIVVWESSGDMTVTGSDLFGVEFMIVAGGGSGSNHNGVVGNITTGGGGGGGGLVSNMGELYFVAKEGIHVVAVGAGGPVLVNGGSVGGNSTFSVFTAMGGGYGGARVRPAQSGGSGGGAAFEDHPNSSTGGNPILGVPGQGNNGGSKQTSGSNSGAGGGGAGTAGSPNLPGAGLEVNITGTSVYYAGGGAPGRNNSVVSGGVGGGGDGASGSPYIDATAGVDGLGGGGGGCSRYYDGVFAKAADGGDGIVIVRWPTANEA